MQFKSRFDIFGEKKMKKKSQRLQYNIQQICWRGVINSANFLKLKDMIITITMFDALTLKREKNH